MTRKLWKIGWFWIFTLMGMPLLAGCPLLPAEVQEGETTIRAEAKIVEPTKPPTTDAVCNPFGNGDSTSLGGEFGLKAELFYLDESLPHFQEVNQYIENGIKLDATLFLDQVNVPTRPFDEGFITTDGRVLQTPAGDTLYEWFALQMESELRLATGDTQGRYQFAMLADDGAVAFYQSGDEWKVLVDNDGEHGTKFKVSQEPITFDGQTRLPIKIQYYQGPRFHIAAVLLWRLWPEEAGAWKDPLDGKVGNDLYFDSTKKPSEPQQAYKDLLARGWMPVKASNYYLPMSVPENPCPVQEDPEGVPSEDPGEEQDQEQDPTTDTGENDPVAELAIEGFDGTTTETTVDLIWQTPGVSSIGTVYWGTSADDLSYSKVEENSVSTSHIVRVEGLAPSTLYYFQVEVSDGQGNSLRSDIIHKATK